MAQENSEIGVSREAMHTLAGYSAMAGLCPLIPIPFLDDVIIDRVHRRMLQKLSAQHDAYLSQKDAKFMTSKPSNLLSGALKGLLLWPVKKLLKKVIYVLAIKSCADVATAVFHEGWLFARALEQGYIEPSAIGRGERPILKRFRDSINRAVDTVDPDATRQLMNSAFGIGREVIDSVGSALQNAIGGDDENLEGRLDDARGEVGPLTERIEAELMQHWALTEALDDALVRELGIVANNANTE